MMGVAALTVEPNDLEAARFHLDTAKDMLDELKKQHLSAGLAAEVSDFAVPLVASARTKFRISRSLVKFSCSKIICGF
jgi:hypothetical protein